jgi:hypothetical protein
MKLMSLALTTLMPHRPVLQASAFVIIRFGPEEVGLVLGAGTAR